MKWTYLQTEGHPLVPTGILDLKVGKQMRLLLEHKMQLIQLLFLRVCADGSVVCGTGDTSGTMTQTAWRRDSDEPLPANLAPFVPELPIPEGFHLTFHSSGVITMTGGARTFRRTLRSGRPHQLASLRFRMPSLLRRVTAGEGDVVARVKCDRHRALEVLITLVDDHSPVYIADKVNECALLMPILDATGKRGYAVQFTFYHGKEPWGDATTVTWVSKDPEKVGLPPPAW